MNAHPQLRSAPGQTTVRAVRSVVLALLFALLALAFLGGSEPASAVTQSNLIVTDINPDGSTVPPCRLCGYAGRINALAVAPGNPNVAYAATEWGGLYRTTDGGANWARLNEHRANALWDVATDPRTCSDTLDNGGDGGGDKADPDCHSDGDVADANTYVPTAFEDTDHPLTVYATSFYDGRTPTGTSDGGVNVSTDGGVTWTHPTVPDTGTCIGNPPLILNDPAGWDAPDGEPSAFGIGVRPDVGRKVFIGTKCGVAITLDSGVTWNHVDPTPATDGGRIFDVVVHSNGVVDVCGDEGHFRSLDDGQNWVRSDVRNAVVELPTSGTNSFATCSISASPVNPNVIFVIILTPSLFGAPMLPAGLYESDDGGESWNSVFAIPTLNPRPVYSVTNLTDAGPETGANCNNQTDADGDTFINEGCPAVGTDKEDNNQCSNNLDDDGDNFVNDGCPGDADPESGADCANDNVIDDDDGGSGAVNEGCPAVGGPAPEVLSPCTNATDDDDLDGKINDGCLARGFPEFGPQCNDNVDDDGDGQQDDGCGSAGDPPTDSAAETDCDDAADNDNDGFINDGCAAVNNGTVSSGDNSEGADTNQCVDPDGATARDSDADGANFAGRANDGCPLRTFDLYFGDGFLSRRISCTNGQAGNDCTGAITTIATATHDDPGDLEFDPTSPVPRCPLYIANDGGIYRSNDCGATFVRADKGIHAQWLWDIDGAQHAGPPTSTDLFIGAQDVGLNFSRNGGAGWASSECCDVFDIESDASRTLFTLCCFTPAPGTRMFTVAPNDNFPEADLCGNGTDDDNDGTADDGCVGAFPAAVGPPEINQCSVATDDEDNDPATAGVQLDGVANDGCRQALAFSPPGALQGFQQLDSIDQFGPNSYAAVTTSGIYITTDVGATAWTQLGMATTPPNACAVQAATDQATSTTTFYVVSAGAATNGANIRFECSGGYDDDRDGKINEDPQDVPPPPAAQIDNDGDGNTNEDDGGALWKYSGTGPGGCWTRVDLTREDGGGASDCSTNTAGSCFDGADNGGGDGADFQDPDCKVTAGMYAVHPKDPMRLYVSRLAPTAPTIVSSSDGGATWTADAPLTALVAGTGFKAQPFTGALDLSTNGAYAQPSLLEISPHVTNNADYVILAGGRDSGVFISKDNGGAWEKIAITPRCGNSINDDPSVTDAIADDGCPGGPAAVGEPEKDEDLPRPWDAYFDPSGTFYIGTQGRGIWKVTGLGAAPVSGTTATGVSCGVGNFFSNLARLAPDGTTVSAHLSDLHKLLQFLDTSLAGSSGLNVAAVMNAVNPGAVSSLQELIDKLERNVTEGGLSGEVAGIDVLIDAGFDIGGGVITMDLNLTMSKTVDSPLNLAAGGDTFGLSLDGTVPLTLTFNLFLKFGFDDNLYDASNPDTCKDAFFLQNADIKLTAESNVRDLVIDANLGFAKLTTDDDFDTPGEPDEGADFDVKGSVDIVVVDPDPTSPVPNRITVREIESTSNEDLWDISPHGHVRGNIPIRTNLFDVTAPETGANCNDSDDDDRDGLVNDGCPADGSEETDCGKAEAAPLDDDSDGKANDGCPRSDPRVTFDLPLNPGTPALVFQDFDALNPFNNLSAIGFLTALGGLIDWLQSLQNTGALDTELPFADATLGDIVAISDRLHAALTSLVDPQTGQPTFTDAEDFQAKFRTALALALGVPEEALPPLPLNYDPITRVLSFDLNMSDQFSTGAGEGRTPTCADIVNNGADAGADTADTDCHTDGNASNADSYDPSRVEDGVQDGTCGDGVDNDAAQGTDAADPSCHIENSNLKPYVPGRGEQKGTCEDGVDNDNDGQIDNSDAQCKAPLNFSEDLEVVNGVQLSASATAAVTAGYDLDLTFALDLRDFPDNPVESTGAAEDSCRDNIDNDGVGGTDALDPDCGPREAGGGPGTCTDTIDNNGDGITDGAAPECNLTEGGASCYNGVDDDGDLFKDLADGECLLTIEDRLFIRTDGQNELKLDVQFDGVVSASAMIGILGVNLTNGMVHIGASEDPATNTCNDTFDNAALDPAPPPGDGLIDTLDPDCHTDGNAGNATSYSIFLPEDGFGNSDCSDGQDNDDDGAEVIDGYIDVDGDSAAPPDTGDDGTINGVPVIDGALDLNGDSVANEDDDGVFAGIAVIDGLLDIAGGGSIANNDDGSLFTDANDPQCHVFTVDLTDPSGGDDKITLPELLEAINDIESLLDADLTGYVDASATISATLGGTTLGSGDLIVAGGINAQIATDGNEDGAGPDSCTDGNDNQAIDDPTPPLADGADDEDTDCTPLVAGLVIDAHELDVANLLDFDTDDPFAVLIRLLEMLDALADQVQQQEGSVLNEPLPVVGGSVADILSYSGDLADLAKGLKVAPEGDFVCSDSSTDDDSDGTPNDGCPGAGPAVGAPESEWPCRSTDIGTDDDRDGFINDGCPAKGSNEEAAGNPCLFGSTPACGAGAGDSCANTADDDADGIINDGCAGAQSEPFPEADCETVGGAVDPAPEPDFVGLDDDHDGFVNDGCATAQPTLQRVENQIEMLLPGGQPESICGAAGDEDNDTLHNEGCPQVGGASETGTQCENSANDGEADGAINDGCPDNLTIQLVDTAPGSDLVFHLRFGLKGSTEVPLNFDLPGVPADLIGLEADIPLMASAEGRLDLDFGIELNGTSVSDINIFLLDSSDLTISASVGSTAFQIEGNIGPLTALVGNVAESTCGPAGDEDFDGIHNEGCPAAGSAENPQCTNNLSDDEADGKVNDGCPQAGAEPETGAQCNNDVDDDTNGADGFINDGCPEAGAASEDQLQCKDDQNNDGDAGGEVNDGCPAAPPTANLGAALNIFMDSVAGDKVYIGTLDLSDFCNPGVDVGCGLGAPASNPSNCGTNPICAVLPMYLGGKYICTLTITASFTAAPTVTPTEPPDCGIANEIANAALDLILLNSGLGELLTMLENLLNGNLFGFEFPLLGNLGLGTEFVQKLRENLVESITDPSAATPAEDLKQIGAQLVVATVEEFRDAIACALLDPAGDGDPLCPTNGPSTDRLLKDRGTNGVGLDDLKFVLICDISNPASPKLCGYGPEQACDDVVDDDNDTKVNDGCTMAGTTNEQDACGNAFDGDGDTKVNDGCPAAGTPANPEVTCGDTLDNAPDGDTNEGADAADDDCHTDGDASTPAGYDPNRIEDGIDNCTGSVDNDSDGKVNDGCPADGAAEVGDELAVCDNATNEDANDDTKINDGCPVKDPEGFSIQEIRFFATIGQTGGVNPNIGFDIGLPGLGLQSTGQVNFNYGWEVNIGFGVSKEDAFFLLTEPMEDGLTEDSCDDNVDNDGDGLIENDGGTPDPDCDGKELSVNANVNLDPPGDPQTTVGAKLAFLQVTATDGHTGNDAGAEFFIDITDPGTGAEDDGRMTFGELLDAPSFGDVVTFDLTANVNLLLNITTTVDLDNNASTVDPSIPQITGDLGITWRWSLNGQTNSNGVGNNTTECDGNAANDATEDCLAVTFDNLRINVGTFLTNMIGPVAEEIQTYTKPIQPAIDILTTPIPVLSDLAGTPITLLDLIITLGQGDLDMLDEIAAVLTFINSFDESAVNGLVIPIAPDTNATSDDYTLNGANLTKPLTQAENAFKAGELSALQSTNMLEDMQQGDGAANNATAQQKGALAALKQLTEDAGVSFPFLENPADMMQMLFGKDVTLALWEPPNLEASFGYSQSFGPVWALPPVFVHIGGSVTLKGHFGLGYDTEGIRQVTGGAKPVNLLNGLFLADTSNGQDVPEFSMRGELVAGASISVLIFSAGAEGGIFLTINIDLQDPNGDGKLKYAEVADIIEITGNPLCIFILSGEFGAFLRVFVEVDLFFWSQRWTFTLAEIVIWSFQVECDLDPQPNLASAIDADANVNTGIAGKETLRLNMGPNAPARGAMLSVEDEEFTVMKNPSTGRLEVSAFGFIECDFNDDGDCDGDDGGITRVTADGGTGADVIAALPNTLKSEDGLQTCGDTVDNSDVANGTPSGNGDGDADASDDDCHTDSDASDPDATYRADLAEDGIDACADGQDNSGDGKADKGVKVNGDADFTDPGEFPPDPDCAGQPVEFDLPVEFSGGAGEDQLTAGIVNDILRGGDNNDSITAERGDDDIVGGNGDDELIGGPGFDVILGDVGTIDDDTAPVNARTGDPGGTDTTVNLVSGSGADYIDAGLGTDHAWGQGGDDNMVGGLSITATLDGVDRLHGGDNDDTIDGGDGDDRLFGDNGEDNVNGSGGADRIEGGNETAVASDLGDNLLGSAGADRIFGQGGDDNVIGGDGADPELRGGDHDDVLLGDNGFVDRKNDVARFDDVVTLDPGDPGSHIDDMEGNAGNDWLYGQEGADVMKGEGDVREDGGAAGTCTDGLDNGPDGLIDSADPNCTGDDDLVGGPAADEMHGGPGVDIMVGDTGSVDHNNSAARSDDSAVLAPAGDDGNDNPMNGDAGNDEMFGEGGIDTMNGGDGADLMQGNTGNDIMKGNPGDDDMFGNSGLDSMEGNQDFDEMWGGSGIDSMIGGSSINNTADTGDRMFGEADPDIMVGDNGTISGVNVDLLNLNPIGGDDYMEGNSGADDMYGGPGFDEMHGLAGDDYMEGNNDSDVMTGDADQDDMIGGSSLESAGVEGTIADAGDNMSGGESFDVMAGDNASITRPGGVNTFNPSVIRTVTLYDVDEVGEPAITAGTSGGDIMNGDAADDVMYGQGNGGHGVDDDGDTDVDEDPPDGEDNDGDTLIDEDGAGDVMHGNDGDDHMEGNHGDDMMFGDLDQDDMIGGGSLDYDADSTEPDLRDGVDTMFGESGAVEGTPEGSHADAMAGDNASIVRPLVPSGPNADEWTINTFNDAVTRVFTLLDVETVANQPLSADLSGGDTMWGNDNDDVMYGQGENDIMHGNAGEDYMEGNSGSDTMTGDDGNDDMVGGTGRINADPPTGTNGRSDDGELNMTGGNGFDNMAGDNAIIKRVLDGNGQWVSQTFRDCSPDPDSACNGVQHERIILLDINSPDMAIVSGGDTMFGNAHDDVMYGQGNGSDTDDDADTAIDEDPADGADNDGDAAIDEDAGGDVMHGNDAEDYIEGNHGADFIFGDSGQDDLIGGTGRIGSDPAAGIDGRVDGDDNMFGESDKSQGTDVGNGSDAMTGDNAIVTRPLVSGGRWEVNTFNVAFARSVQLLDVETLANTPLSANVHGDDDMWGNDNDDILYGQGGNDEEHGNSGEDYLEGNAGDDTLTGDVGQDDIIGGTGATTNGSHLSELTTAERATAVDGRLDGDDDIFGEDSLSGQGTENGDGADAILGDNGTIERPLDLLLAWQVNTFNGNYTRLTSLLDVEFTGSGNYPLDSRLSGDDEIWGNDNDDIVYGQGGNDLIHGNAGFDYLEGNAASDTMFGEDGEDDMLGGSGPTISKSQLAPLGPEASASAVVGRTDVSTLTRNVPLAAVASQVVPLGDTMYGGNGADEMIGDNGTINRQIPGGQWITLNYSLLAATIGDVVPRHPTGGPSARIDRDVAMLETTPGLTANSDLMFGGDGDDQMYGQFDDTAGATQPAIGDEMHGENGEDAMAGDQGNFLERVLTGATVHIQPNEPFVDDDIFILNSLYREFRMLQIPNGGNDRMRGGNDGDWMHGGAGADVANGDNGNDHIFGNNGDDDIWGGRHHDHIWGGRDSDQLDLHPRVTESDSLPNACGQLSPADPQEWYTFAFEGGVATTTCDGNLEDVDYIYGGWGADALQANVGDNGPRIGDRLFDWVGTYNLFILCPGTYGEFVSTREFSPQMTEFLHRLAEGDGAYRPGTAVTDPSGFNDIAFVFRPDLKSNKNPPYVDTPAHFNCTADSTSIP